MQLWYEIDGSAVGPVSVKELKAEAASGRLPREALVWKDGSSKRQPAASIPGLFPQSTSTPASAEAKANVREVSVEEPTQSQAAAVAVQTLQAAKGHTANLLHDLRGVKFKDEVLPVDTELAGRMSKDVIFWAVTALAVVPLLISTIERTEYQLTAFALFFAVLWGVVFKLLVVRSSRPWTPLIGSLLFTGCVGIPILLFGYRTVTPDAYLAMASSKSGVVSLAGFVIQVGVCEELVKIVPVIGYMTWKRKQADPIHAVLIGVFSGLGFAAFENMDYGWQAIVGSARQAYEDGVLGAARGTHTAMVLIMLRSLSLVFCHAVWSGIFAYFITTGFATGKRLPAMFVIGLAVSAVLHGVYDWLTMVQMTFATFVVAGSFVLFYSYLTKLRLLVGAELVGDTGSETATPVPA